MPEFLTVAAVAGLLVLGLLTTAVWRQYRRPRRSQRVGAHVGGDGLQALAASAGRCLGRVALHQLPRELLWKQSGPVSRFFGYRP